MRKIIDTLKALFRFREILGSEKPNWIVNDGGPFMLLQKDLFELWSPADLKKAAASLNPQTSLGLVKVGEGVSIVFDTDFQTTWIPSETTGTGYIISWLSGEDQEKDTLQVLLDSAPEGTWNQKIAEIEFTQPDQIMASASKKLNFGSIDISLPAGRYAIRYTNFDDGDIEFNAYKIQVENSTTR